MKSVCNKSFRRFFSFVGVVAVLTFAAQEGALGACPKRRPGENSDCAYTVCTPQQCATRGFECCPKPCGGTWCVKGVGPPSEYPEICPMVPLQGQSCPEQRSNATCEELKCTNLGFICCRNGCEENYCYQVPGTASLV